LDKNTALGIIRYDLDAGKEFIVDKIVAKGNRIINGHLFKLEYIGKEFK
jgi:hypothetical protein